MTAQRLLRQFTDKGREVAFAAGRLDQSGGVGTLFIVPTANPRRQSFSPKNLRCSQDVSSGGWSKLLSPNLDHLTRHETG
jgi:hypothetical protein